MHSQRISIVCFPDVFDPWALLHVLHHIARGPMTPSSYYGDSNKSTPVASSVMMFHHAISQLHGRPVACRRSFCKLTCNGYASNIPPFLSLGLSTSTSLSSAKAHASIISTANSSCVFTVVWFTCSERQKIIANRLVEQQRQQEAASQHPQPRHMLTGSGSSSLQGFQQGNGLDAARRAADAAQPGPQQPKNAQGFIPFYSKCTRRSSHLAVLKHDDSV